MLKKKWEYNGMVHEQLVHLKKACDSVKREVLNNILLELGITKKLVRPSHSLTHFMLQDIILKADCYSAHQKISRFLTEPEGSSPCSQKPANGPYPEPAESSSPH
jgi:hypothetical protein